MIERCQGLGKRKLDDSFVGKRLEYLSESDMGDEGTKKELRWCAGTVEKVSDGTWIMPGKRSKCFKEGESARVF